MKKIRFPALFSLGVFLLLWIFTGCSTAASTATTKSGTSVGVAPNSQLTVTFEKGGGSMSQTLYGNKYRYQGGERFDVLKFKGSAGNDHVFTATSYSYKKELQQDNTYLIRYTLGYTVDNGSPQTFVLTDKQFTAEKYGYDAVAHEGSGKNCRIINVSSIGAQFIGLYPYASLEWK